MRDEWRASFRGAKTLFNCWMRRDGDDYYIKVRRFRSIPFLYEWRKIYGNITNHLTTFKEIQLFDVEEGRTEDVVREYPLDFDTLEKNFIDSNSNATVEIQQLTEERNYLYRLVRELQEQIKTLGSNDLLKSRFKDDYSFFTGLKPGFLHNQKKDEVKKK